MAKRDGRSVLDAVLQRIGDCASDDILMLTPKERLDLFVKILPYVCERKADDDKKNETNDRIMQLFSLKN